MEELIKQIQDLRIEMAGIKSETIDSIIASCVPVIVVDLETRVIVYSTSLADTLFGYMEGELQGKLINDIIPVRFHDNHDQHIKEYSNHPTSRAMGSRGMELVGRKRDGTEFNVQISLHPRAIAGKRYVVATPVTINGK